MPRARACCLSWRKCIEPGSVVHTDGWPGYSGLKKEGYVHQVTVVSRQEQSASELMPRVHRVMSLLKRWLLGTHQGAVSHKHLDYTWTSSPSVSTAANPKAEANSSIGSSSRR